ncbi:MAG: triose-phosphate isomerase [Prevotellaceae bacterium]|jgi:triosephosphate isomerase|nr:triose-phosphate isomerase [Prevotellaceae bacterium]
MQKKIVAGNWKMNTTYQEGETLAKAIAAKKNETPGDVLLIVAPPFTHLCCLTGPLRDAGIGVAAQNCAAEEKGAYTGEVSAKMLASIDVEYCIIGHSERREYYGETNGILFKKVQQALAAGLCPIFCVGEVLAEREANRHFETVRQQLEEVILKLTPADFAKIIIAYEPVWAIGTGKTATSGQAQEMHAHIRNVLAGKFGDAAKDTAILYGGSCKPSNAKELFAQPDVAGGLIGGASLVADEFIAIARSY